MSFSKVIASYLKFCFLYVGVGTEGVIKLLFTSKATIFKFVRLDSYRISFVFVLPKSDRELQLKLLRFQILQ